MSLVRRQSAVATATTALQLYAFRVDHRACSLFARSTSSIARTLLRHWCLPAHRTGSSGTLQPLQFTQRQFRWSNISPGRAVHAQRASVQILRAVGVHAVPLIVVVPPSVASQRGTRFRLCDCPPTRRSNSCSNGERSQAEGSACAPALEAQLFANGTQRQFLSVSCSISPAVHFASSGIARSGHI